MATCFVCGAGATSRCDGCNVAAYCGTGCQQKAWHAHDHVHTCAFLQRYAQPRLGWPYLELNRERAGFARFVEHCKRFPALWAKRNEVKVPSVEDLWAALTYTQQKAYGDPNDIDSLDNFFMARFEPLYDDFMASITNGTWSQLNGVENSYLMLLWRNLTDMERAEWIIDSGGDDYNTFSVEGEQHAAVDSLALQFPDLPSDVHKLITSNMPPAALPSLIETSTFFYKWRGAFWQAFVERDLLAPLRYWSSRVEPREASWSPRQLRKLTSTLTSAIPAPCAAFLQRLLDKIQAVLGADSVARQGRPEWAEVYHWAVGELATSLARNIAFDNHNLSAADVALMNLGDLMTRHSYELGVGPVESVVDNYELALIENDAPVTLRLLLHSDDYTTCPVRKIHWATQEDWQTFEEALVEFAPDQQHMARLLTAKGRAVRHLLVAFQRDRRKWDIREAVHKRLTDLIRAMLYHTLAIETSSICIAEDFNELRITQVVVGLRTGCVPRTLSVVKKYE